MEDTLILRDVLQNYIIRQSDTDRKILNLLINDGCKEHEISRITGFTLSKVGRVIRRLRVYLRKLDYN